MTLGRGSSASGQLARLGFTEPALAAAALESGALGPLLDHEQVLLDLAATADPDAGLHALATLLTAADDPALVTALHEDGRRFYDAAVAHELLSSIGQPPAVWEEAQADPTTHDDVRADHERVVAHGGFGVPTLFFPDGQCLFGPVVVDPPHGDDALALWDLVVSWTRFGHLYEIQRPKQRADQELIAETFKPYLTARNWNTIQNPTP